MANRVDILLPLQDLDREIHALRVQIREKPEALRVARERVEREKAEVAARAAEIKELKLEGARHDLEVKEFDEKIKKFQMQSSQVKKNDEYQAILKEITGVRADRSKVEDGLLEVYIKIEDTEKRQKEQEAAVRAAEQDISKETARVEGETAELKKRLAEMEGRRKAACQGVEAEMLRLYERILAAKEDGMGLAPVVPYDILEDEEGKGRMVKRFVCQGCSMDLTAQEVNLLLKGRETMFCRNCSRILYLAPVES